MKNKIIIMCLILSVIIILCGIFVVAYNNAEIKNHVSIIGNEIIEPDRIVYRNSNGEYYEFLKDDECYNDIKDLLQKSIKTYIKDGVKLSDDEIDEIHDKTIIEFDYKTVSKNYIIQLDDNNKQAVIKLADEGGNVCAEKIGNVKEINKLLNKLTREKNSHTLEYKSLYSRNTLNTIEYKYLQLFKSINYKIYQVKIDNIKDYKIFETICNIATDEQITDETFENNTIILTLSLVPKIDVKVNIGNIKYTYDKLENANYQYNVHLLIVDKIVNTDCIYNTDLTEISNKVEYDNMKVTYDDAVDNIDEDVFVEDFDSFIEQYKNSNSSITKQTAAEIAEKGFKEAERICGTYDKSSQTVEEMKVLPNNFFTRKIKDGDSQYIEKIDAYVFIREDDMLNGVEIYVDKKLGKIIGGRAFGD